MQPCPPVVSAPLQYLIHYKPSEIIVLVHFLIVYSCLFLHRFIHRFLLKFQSRPVAKMQPDYYPSFLV